MTARAALYLRSSKDRSDVSLDAQRRELTAIATDRQIEIVQEYADAVESAKTEHRPAFQRLLSDLRSPKRGWNHLLMLDTSRLSRNRYVAHAFKHECELRNITIIWAKVPDTDPVSQIILQSVFEAMDQVHSMLSREKGLAGMRENVHQGYRAGGRAPWGYDLERIPTGAQRDGEPVTKSRLVPNAEAAIVGRYLSQRALGLPRKRIMEELGFKRASSTLIGVEWNALTYAGHTVWNVCYPREAGHCQNRTKRRPRSEWVVQKNTHEALITDGEAETILDRLENSSIGKAVSAAKSGASAYLLSGLLEAPDGRVWTGFREMQFKHPRYRLRRKGKTKGRTVDAASVDRAVMDQVIADMSSARFARALLREAQKSHDRNGGDPAADLRRELVTINGQIAKAMDLSLELESPGPALRKVDELERQRRAVSDEIDRLEREHQDSAALGHVTPQQVQRMLRERLELLTETDPAELKPTLTALVEKVVLDPGERTAEIHYRITAGKWLSLATPGGDEGWPPLRAVRGVQVA